MQSVKFDSFVAFGKYASVSITVRFFEDDEQVGNPIHRQFSIDLVGVNPYSRIPVSEFKEQTERLLGELAVTLHGTSVEAEGHIIKLWLDIREAFSWSDSVGDELLAAIALVSAFNGRRFRVTDVKSR